LRNAFVLTLFVLTACPGPTCPAGFVGTPGATPTGSIVFTDGTDPTLRPLTSGQMVPLEPPPQGGYVMYVAAKVLHMDACVEVSGKLRDPATSNQVGFDARTTTLIRSSDGSGVPDGTNNANLSNLNGCPDYTTRDIHNQDYLVEVDIKDRSGRTLHLSDHITPRCNLSNPALQADCICTCSANYFLGKCGLADGGI